MADYVTTIRDNDNNHMLPRTELKAIKDANGNYLDNTLAASDVNILKNGKISSMDTTIAGKLDSADVYNGLDRTTEGKALDARQGKVLNDALSDINTKIGTFKVLSKEITDQGSGTITLKSFSSALISTSRASDSLSSLYFIAPAGNGSPIAIPIKTGNSISVDNSVSNKIVVSSTSSSSYILTVVVLYGDISLQ